MADGRQTAAEAMRRDGTRLFKIMNWELFASPTPAMRALSMAGSGLFLGILGYFYFQDKPQPQSQRQKSTQ